MTQAYANVIEAAGAAGTSAAIYISLAGGFLTDDFTDDAPRHSLAKLAR